MFEYDVFISHASEDKEAVARPLAKALEDKGFKVWYDETTLSIGDNLRRRIDEGLSKSRYGIVILSPDFLRKGWPGYELDGLVARELADSVKVILPIWHNVSSHDIRQYSLPLSLRLGGNVSSGIESLAEDLADIISTDNGRIKTPEVQDELSLSKQAILSGALADENRIFIYPATMGSGKCLVLGKNGFNDSEKQRKLFLYALSELESAGLVEAVSESTYELTYPGIQAAERMPPFSLEESKKLGL